MKLIFKKYRWRLKMMKHKHKNPSSIKDGVPPTKERRSQNGGVYVEVIRRDPKGHSLIKRYRAVWECPLDAYRDLGVINSQEHKAGLKFRRLYYATVICRAVNDRGTRPEGDNQVDKFEKQLRSAIQTLPPPSKETVIAVCGHNQVFWSSQALEKLRKGLGHLALNWHRTAIEVADHKPRLS
jgi:hypothetical protein